MAVNDVSLTSAMRSNLLSLQQTSTMMGKTQTRLSTGYKVNSPIDDPLKYFTALGERNRASDLTGLKDGMSEAIQTVQAAQNGVQGITDLLNQAKSLAQSALSQGTTGTDVTSNVSNLASQFDEILRQIDSMSKNSSYKGVNLLESTSVHLTVQFDEKSVSTTSHNYLQMDGFAATSGGLNIGRAVSADTGVGTTSAVVWSDVTSVSSTAIQSSIDQIGSALTTLRNNTSTLASNLSVITIRQDFTNNMINTLQTGADNLTLADTNEEGAKMLMLQTRQSLGTTSLSLASQAAQAVLRLF